MGCRTPVEVWVPKGFDGYLAKRKCGDTHIDGNEIRCPACSTRRPWYICRHGQDVSEYMCGRCEGESE